ncbi:MAG TPA: S41 family peptidase [Gemmatimonadaceae bacterium]|nr:S41 family peptidase [Gemmatimonadaceae bacterium]
MSTVRRATALAIALALATSTAMAQRADSAKSPIRKRTAYEDLQMFSQALNLIRVNHPDSVDMHELLMAAVEGMVSAADPHSYVIPAMRLDPAKQEAYEAGKLYPVPVRFTFVGGAPIVVSVDPGSHAAAQDILVGDELVAVDSAPVTAESAMELEIALAGRKNSTVTLSLERRRLDGSLAHLDRVVKRERVDETSAVPVAVMLDSITGYVRITTFENDKVADDLHDALGRLEKQGMQRLVLDLRDNGGGRVDQAAKIAGEFLPKGDIVYTASGRKADVTDTGRVSRSFWSHEKRYPMVLMVNGGTASASELVAGALQDHDRALIVGRPTFGKALLMRGFPMTDGSVMVLVVGHIATPCGRVIQRQYHGITTREYYRLARAERDTAGRPSCHTDGGRVVYGGGGIYPDVVTPEPSGTPVWLARVREEDVVLKWIGGYVSANGAQLTSADALAAHPALPSAALTEFRAFAASQGTPVPDGAEADTLLERMLVGATARVKFGDAGYYRVSAVLDPAIANAARMFDRAQAILAKAN